MEVSMNNRSGSIVVELWEVLERELPVQRAHHCWSICQPVCTKPGSGAIVSKTWETLLWPNSGRVNGLRRQVFLPGTFRSGKAVLVQRCPSGGRAMKMDAGEELPVPSHLPGESTWVSSIRLRPTSQ